MNLEFILEIEKNTEQGNAINSLDIEVDLTQWVNRYIWIAFIESIDNDIIKLLLKIYEIRGTKLIMVEINIGIIKIKKEIS